MHLEKRMSVLANALSLEALSSHFLAMLLEIDIKSSRMLGNKSGGLSFDQKISLLTEIGAIRREVKAKLTMFMSIRNQFMHNIEANTFEDACRFVEGSSNFLLRNYPQDEQKPMEERLNLAFTIMANELIQQLMSLENIVKDKIRKDIYAESHEASHHATVYAIGELKNAYNDLVAREKDLLEGNLDRLGSKIAVVFAGLWKEKFDEFRLSNKDKNG